MSLSQHTQNNITNKVNEDLFEKVILQNDLAGLSSLEKVQHVKNVCESLGLNPLTKPIQLHKFNGKEVMYMAKDGAEQIRNLHNVSIVKLETEFVRNDLYVVKAYATKPNGRQDCSTSAISILGLKGDAIGNAMKKAETQAKRRVTLSICGLGMLDETELENLPIEKRANQNTFLDNHGNLKVLPSYFVKNEEKIQDIQNLEEILNKILNDIENCKNEKELYDIFILSTRDQSIRGNKEIIEKIIQAKDQKKNALLKSEDIQEFINEYDETTGEIK